MNLICSAILQISIHFYVYKTNYIVSSHTKKTAARDTVASIYSVSNTIPFRRITFAHAPGLKNVGVISFSFLNDSWQC